jgi:hypothetical protein
VVGVTPESGSSRAPQPTRAAYRYVRGTDGWTTSPIGDNSFNIRAACEDNAGIADTEHDSDIVDDLCTFVPDDTGILTAPLGDQANVDKQGKEWAELWLTKQKYINPLFDLQLNMFKGLAADLIPIAAMTFPGDTGLCADNMSLRAVTRLSSEAIAALAQLFLAFERFGDWPTLYNLVLIVLLP